jgi:hypothetical protein
MPDPIVTVTEDFQARQFSTRLPLRASRVYEVQGIVDDVVAASKAVDSGDPAKKVPQKNAAYFSGSRLRCEGPELEAQRGPDFYRFRCEYSIAEGGVHFDQPDDPLDEEPRIGWQTAEMMIPIDVDLGGRPMVNAAGDALTAVRRLVYKKLRIVRPEPFYDLDKAERFENTVSSEPVDLGRGIIIKAHRMRCNTVIPVDEYAPSSDSLRILYDFDLFLGDAPGTYPFQAGFLNAGRNGWRQEGTGTAAGSRKVGQFVTTGTGQAVAFDQDVRLDLFGKPMPNIDDYALLKVDDGGQGAAAVAKPGQVAFWQSEEIREPDAPGSPGSGGKILGYRVWYRISNLADLNGLGL